MRLLLFIPCLQGKSVSGLEARQRVFFFNEEIDSITIICGTSLIICNTLMVRNVKKRKYEKNILPNN